MAKPTAPRLFIGGCLALWLLIIAAPASADTLYVWYDNEGYRHFSNLKPPKDVRQFSTIESRISTLPCEGAKPRRRAYDQMIEEYQRESHQTENDRRQAIETQSARNQREFQNQLDAQISAERQWLEDQIQQLRQRAVSPTYPAGMRSRQIRTLEEQLNLLETDPYRYFQITQ